MEKEYKQFKGTVVVLAGDLVNENNIIDSIRKVNAGITKVKILHTKFNAASKHDIIDYLKGMFIEYEFKEHEFIQCIPDKKQLIVFEYNDFTPIQSEFTHKYQFDYYMRDIKVALPIIDL